MVRNTYEEAIETFIHMYDSSLNHKDISLLKRLLRLPEGKVLCCTYTSLALKLGHTQPEISRTVKKLNALGHIEKGIRGKKQTLKLSTQTLEYFRENKKRIDEFAKRLDDPMCPFATESKK